MFDFTSGARKKRVQAIFTNRMNQKCIEEMQGSERGPDRSSFVRAVATIPRDGRKKWAFDRAFPSVSRDISPEGMALIHTERLEGELIIELVHDGGSTYVKCQVQHCSDLGYGFYQIGLHGEEEVALGVQDRQTLNARMATFDTADASA